MTAVDGAAPLPVRPARPVGLAPRTRRGPVPGARGRAPRRRPHPQGDRLGPARGDTARRGGRRRVRPLRRSRRPRVDRAAARVGEPALEPTTSLGGPGPTARRRHDGTGPAALPRGADGAGASRRPSPHTARAASGSSSTRTPSCSARPCACTVDAFALLEHDDQARVLDSWGRRARRLLPRARSVTRVTWSEWAAPASLEEHLRFVRDEHGEPAPPSTPRTTSSSSDAPARSRSRTRRSSPSRSTSAAPRHRLGSRRRHLA